MARSEQRLRLSAPTVGRLIRNVLLIWPILTVGLFVVLGWVDEYLTSVDWLPFFEALGYAVTASVFLGAYWYSLPEEWQKYMRDTASDGDEE